MNDSSELSQGEQRIKESKGREVAPVMLSELSVLLKGHKLPASSIPASFSLQDLWPRHSVVLILAIQASRLLRWPTLCL